ncbi:MAG TPA: IS5 family transposase [Desulfobacter sp.]|nr:IS5 family transposase [Desulfobacter sp.]
MYKSDQKQLKFENFYLPFGGKLRSDNRWVKLAKLIPWADFEELYANSLAGTGMGAPAKSVRVALGALIIKERLGTADEETVEQIRENPYLQYFLGFEEYRAEAPFDPSMFVHFRKRLGKKVLAEINDAISEKAMAESSAKSKGKGPSNKNDNDADPPSGQGGNNGKLLVDASCAPADITFPTDLKIVNEAREKSEEIIDTLHAPMKGKQKKPRTYRKKARRQFLAAAKQKQLSHRKRRQAMRQQLGYLSRNLKSIASLNNQRSLSLLKRRQYKNLLVIEEVHRQQGSMFVNQINRIDDRIVSISQPHVRPIKRGKPGAATEFGAKISVSLVNGFSFVDRLSWDSYNESGDLKAQIKKYRERFGCWPESVHADKIYRTRENRKFCKKHGIRLSGPALGRPPKQAEASREIRKQIYQDEVARNGIEGKFGQGKRRFGLGRVMSKLASTSESAILVTFLVMNLERWLKAIIFWLFYHWAILAANALHVQAEASN